MHEFHYTKEHVIARTFHKTFRLIKKCLLLGLMVAVSLKAQQSSPSARAWTGVVRTAAGEPVAGAKVTVFTSGAKKNPTAVTGTDGRFAIADLRLGPHTVSVQLPGRGPTASTGVDITGIAVVLKVSDQNVLSIGADPQTSAAGVSNGNPSTTSNAASGTNGEKLYSQTWTLGLERAFGGLTADVAYVGTSAFRLPRMSYPNAYPGADPEFARFTNFDGSGAVTGGFGLESVMTATSHSSYNALQTSLSGNVGHGGPSLQAGYTWGKSLDDVSGIIGGTGSTGAVTLFSPQNPFATGAERGPSSFDVTHAFTLSAAQDLHFERLGLQSDRTQLLTKGWELLSISTITSGSPFTVYSGIQQTGAGTIGADRPDQIETPDLSSAGSSTRPRDDYFGRGANNASFFAIPVGIAGGTGPNSGRFGTLGRNTFRGPAYYDFDFALIKTTPIGHRESGLERADLQFRAELFNLFNIVNMGLPANLIEGTGFGMISKTAGTSRQIQFSLKLIY